MTNFRCEECNKDFGSSEALNMHNKSKHYGLYKEPKKSLTTQQKKKIRNWFILILVLVIIISGISFLILNVKNLPPTGMEGHIEENPPSHVLKEPMPIAIQKHMLEHADGEGPPGVIINYNCVEYDCSEDLISKLENFADKYPEFVYVAPFKKMDAKIAITRLGEIEVLGEFDEESIDDFINRR